MKRRWIKGTLLVLLIPVILFALLIVGLYIPTVQNYIQREAMQYVSKATGMDITIRRVDLRFPLNLLLRDVSVVSYPDTLLTFERLNIRVQALPLLHKRVKLDELTLSKAQLNTGNQIDGVLISGRLGEFKMGAKEINLDTSFAHIDELSLRDTDLSLVLTDTVTQDKDTVSTPLAWNILVDQLAINDSQLDIDVLKEAQKIALHIPKLKGGGISASLSDEAYSLNRISLENGALHYQKGLTDTVQGINPNDLRCSDLTLVGDSIVYTPDEIKANLSSFSLKEQSGLVIDTLKGRIWKNKNLVSGRGFLLETPQSRLSLDFKIPMDWCESKEPNQLDVDLYLSLQELATLLGVYDARFDYSEWGPITCKVSVGGTAQQTEIKDIYVELSDSFILTATGALQEACSGDRVGQLDVLGDFYNLSCFNSWLSEDNSVHLPQNLMLQGLAAVKGNQYLVEFILKEAGGTVDFKAKYNSETEAYQLRGGVDSLSIRHFLPHEPLDYLTLGWKAEGHGTDWMSKKSVSKLDANLKHLIYGEYLIDNVHVAASLDKGRLTTVLKSDNALLRGVLDGYYEVASPTLNLDYKLDIDHVDLYELRVLNRKLKEDVKIQAGVHTSADSIRLSLNSGDFNLQFGAKRSINDLIDKSGHLLTHFLEQLEARQMDYKDLQAHLPEGSLSWSSGDKNVLSTYLKENNIIYSGSSADFQFNPLWGMKGWAGVQNFQMDSVRVDSLTFQLHQDTTGLRIQAGAVNDGVGTRKETAFRAFVKGLLTDSNARIDVDFEGSKGSKGLLFGVEVSPHQRGTNFILTPEEPVLAFKKFKFREKKNWLFLRDDLRIFSDIDLQENRNLGFKMYSNLADTTSIQNMNIDIRRIQLNDMTRLFPFMPQLDGLFSAEANYIQTDSTLQVSTELFLDSLMYEKKLIGDLGLGVTWLPVGADTDLLDMYLTHDRTHVLFADGTIHKDKGKDNLDLNATFEHFPLHIANAFFPNEEVNLGGDIDGYLHITGTADSPIINGELVLDSVIIQSKQTGAKFYLDSRPVPVVDSKILFKDFSIYTTSRNPFKVNGTVDISKIASPFVDLKLQATNYTLLDAKRTKESIAYGKLYVDVNATLKGPVEALKMKGRMSILDNTDLTYVLTESPLTVQDRLGDLVTFTSFRDTTEIPTDTLTHSLGGLDMVMAIHIDPSVQFKVDLSADRSSRIALQGGGDLSLQYTPQGDFFLIGRYELSDGIMKYSLPVIPAKEFKITSDSYIEWSGRLDNPKLNLIAKDRVRASVTESDGNAHMVNFDVIIGAKNRLDDLELIFDLKAPENVSIQNQLASMDKEERSKQAIGMLATGVYLAGAGDGKGRGLDMGMALNSVLQSQINAIAGSSLKNASFSVGVEEYNMSDTGGRRVDYSFRYSQRFLNNRFQLVLGGRIKTGVEAQNDVESFIDNVSLEYRLDSSGTRFVRLFHNKNYESVLEGEITETGIGLVLRKKLNHLGELFIFKKKKKRNED